MMFSIRPLLRIIALLLFAHLSNGLRVAILGDSYTSGVGANGPGSYDDGSCYRSNNGFGHGAANTIGADTVVLGACAGTTISAVAGQADSSIDSDTDVVILGSKFIVGV